MAESAYRVMTRVLLLLGAVVVFALMVNVVADVSMRYAFRNPIRDTIERVSFWWMPVIAYVGMAIAQENREHIDVPLIHMRVGRRSRLIMDLLAGVAMAVFLAVVGFFAWQNALEQMASGEYRSTVLVWPARFVVPLSVAFFILYVVRDLIHTWSHRHEQVDSGLDLSEESAL